MIFRFNLIWVGVILWYIFFVYMCNCIKLNNYNNKLIIHKLLNISTNVVSRQINKNNNGNEIKNKKNIFGINNLNKCNIMVSCYDKAGVFDQNFFLLIGEKNNIKFVKEQIENIHGIPTNFQEIFYENKILDDNITIKSLIKGKNIKLLNFRLISILPHFFNEKPDEIDKKDINMEKENKKIKILKEKLKYYGCITLFNEYKKLLEKLKNNIIKEDIDIVESFKSFDREFERLLNNNNISLEKIKKEIQDLKYFDKKKLLLRLEVDYPHMDNLLLIRIKELIKFYYLGDIQSVIKFSLFFFILFKYANYPKKMKNIFLYLSLLFLLAPCKPIYKFSHFLFFLIPTNFLYSGFTNILSASYQQILMCQ
ncbi:ubiquitin, putative [Plasmodium berghei]|uniref:Ubiquitin, putative n=2 Tax=Plasmodium berghei TaxID=5821 RepID=A0A509AHJ2_PLABA|nr:ubiquitin, putative [Plasmodium berghei ANKA]SCM20435.1 ubiquitin, putative [Plasmodium berghei]SCN24025.1 ubiquitin, putative [Plasmodium berghei]SCO59359.1 ubiquitin, putative [Plasmodium berghei]SCO60485.1 ubiquitin, putative [Plasmodium berghei]VUC55077.1 ubiquitin, putative [Plasmodium berghei ANKA]|eukprot:XP_034420896.1 ubiquitin, putative [Plasmodium berghei ANKA]